MKLAVVAGTTDYTVLVWLGDSSATDGSAQTGVAFGDITVFFARVETDNDVTSAVLNMNALANLTDPHNDGGWKEVSAGNQPGLYRLDLSDAILAAGAWSTVVTIIDAGANDIAPVNIEIQLTTFDLDSAAPDVNTVQISGDAVAADNLEAVLDGGGIAADVDLTARSLTITNDAGVGVALTGTTIGLDINATNGVGLDIDGTTSGITTDGAAGPGVHAGGTTFGMELTASNGPGLSAVSTGGNGDGIVATANGAGLDIDAATTNGLQVDTVEISGDSGAADNAESFFDGTGYAGTNNVIPTVTTNTDLVTAAAVVNEWETQSQVDPTGFHVNLLEIKGDAQSVTDLKDFADAGYDPGTNKVQGVVLVDTTTSNTDMVAAAPTAAAVVNEWETQSQADPTGFHVNVLEVNGTGQTANDNGADINAILVDTTEIGVAGAGLTNINLPNQTMDIIGDITGNLSGSVASVAAGGIAAASFAAGAVDNAAIATDAIGSAELATSAVDEIVDGTWDEAIAAHGGVGSTGEALAAATAPTAAVVADAVWDEILAGHLGAGSTGEALDAASAPTVGQIADGVWDELIAGHLGAGSTGAQLNAAGAAGDPWITPLPGAYPAGQAGYIVGTNLDATVSSRGTAANQTTILARIGAFTGAGVNTILGFLRAMSRSDLSAPSDMGGTFAPVLHSLEALRDLLFRSGTAGTVSANELTVVRGDSYDSDDDNAIEELGDISAYTKLWVTAKRSRAQADSAAIFMIVLSNPPVAATDGLQYLNGTESDALDAASSISRAWGAITVSDDVAGDLAFTLDEAATDDLRPAGFNYDIQWTDGSDVDTVRDDRGSVTADVTRAIT